MSELLDWRITHSKRKGTGTPAQRFSGSMPRWLALLPLILAACSRGPEADLPSISQARSLAAEWALVNQEAEKGHLTSAYVSTMHSNLREQLRSSLTSLREPQSQYGGEIKALLREPDEASPKVLREHSGRLRAIERSLESA